MMAETKAMAGGPETEKQRRGRRTAAAEQIALEASSLARLAGAHDFPLLSYLIDMVVLEAWREATDYTGRSGAAAAGDGETKASS